MTGNDLFLQWQQQTLTRVETVLESVLPLFDNSQSTLHEAMRYAVLGGGKRLRPLLVLATAQLGEGNDEAAQMAAAAIECIHVYSLAHDDMPEMDNDSLRRGKPTCHVVYGSATALLVGDALQSLAFELISRPSDLDSRQQLAMVQTLAMASGSLGMAGGQAIDLTHVGQDMTQTELECMHSLKTGALIRAAVRLGALCCAGFGSEQFNALDIYAAKIGLAFQVMDDVLDCVQDSQTLGKTAGKDISQDKPTYVKLMGLESARQYAYELTDAAVAALGQFGSQADKLHALAQFVIQRKN